MNILTFQCKYASWQSLIGLFFALSVIAYGQTVEAQVIADLAIDELRGIYVPQSNVLIIAHSRGVLRTEDSGTNWTLHNFPNSCGVTDMEFRGHLGIITEGCRVWRSTDTGKSWNKTGVDGGLGVEFVDSNIIVIVDHQGEGVRSTDAGVTWQRLRGLRGFHLNDVDFIDALRGIVVTNTGNVNLSFDGGLTWEDTTCTFQGFDEPPYLTGVSYVDENILIAVSIEGYIFRSTDNGVNWQRRWSDPCENALEDVEFIDERHGVVVGAGGTILHTIDGGLTWEWEFYDRRFHLQKMQFVDQKEIIVVGDMGVILHKTFNW